MNGKKRYSFLILLAVVALGLFLLPKLTGNGQDPVPTSAPQEAQQSAEEVLPAEEQASEEAAPEPSETPSESVSEPEEPSQEETGSEPGIAEDGSYLTKDEVFAYLRLYGHLPDNFVTKKEAEKAGWEPGDDLWDYLPGCAIGGNRFGNYEGLLPEGRDYKECDVNYKGGPRGPERIVFSEDGLIFYTEDHYTTFEQLYP